MEAPYVNVDGGMIPDVGVNVGDISEIDMPI